MRMMRRPGKATESLDEFLVSQTPAKEAFPWITVSN
jgi:hypothetical protein